MEYGDLFTLRKDILFSIMNALRIDEILFFIISQFKFSGKFTNSAPSTGVNLFLPHFFAFVYLFVATVDVV